MNELIWQGSSYDDLKAFPMDAKQNAGFQLHKVQQGDDPNDWKPMPRIGKGVREIRIKVESGEFRVIYIANIGQRIYVLHCFQKKTQQTSQRDIALAQARFKAIKR